MKHLHQDQTSKLLKCCCNQRFSPPSRWSYLGWHLNISASVLKWRETAHSGNWTENYKIISYYRNRIIGIAVHYYNLDFVRIKLMGKRNLGLCINYPSSKTDSVCKKRWELRCFRRILCMTAKHYTFGTPAVLIPNLWLPIFLHSSSISMSCNES